MSYTFNNKNIHDYDLWCNDNNDELYCILMESGGYYETQDSDAFYEDLYDKELNHASIQYTETIRNRL